MPRGDLLVALRGISKDYRGLRPLRVGHLDLHAGQSLAVLGFDQVAAEVLVDLVTGATSPDRGEVIVFGEPTTAIRDDRAWLNLLDHFGLLSERAVLVDQFTAEQNLILPFTLDLEEVPDSVRAQVRQLGDEIGLSRQELASPTAGLSASARLRIRLGRALALRPQVLLAEHPNASLSADDTASFAADLSRIVSSRGLASLVMTADRTFASAVAEEVLTLQPATGELKRSAGWRRWF
jgi:predicted ABC-type transport system involved in lysophospholipase L1 biosynthesis ATPase subunit